MEISITQYFLLFFIYAFAGWLLEVGCKLIEYKRFINRGFLIGPYCPIYGWGAVLITLLLSRYSYDPIVLFVMTVIVCMILEYITSWTMEKLFKARWWDYSKRKFNLNGRVCLGTGIPFGLFGMFIIYVSNPFIIENLNKINTNTLNIIATTLFVIYLVDNIISTIVILGFRKTTLQVGKEGSLDNTEEITQKVREILLQKSWTYRRLVNAYPKLIAIRYKIKEITEEVKENAEVVRNNINEKAKDVKNVINEKKEYLKNNLNETREKMKETLTDTGTTFVNDFIKPRISLKLGKKKYKGKFKK